MNELVNQLVGTPVPTTAFDARFTRIPEDSLVLDRGIHFKALHCSPQGVVLRRMDETNANETWTQQQVHEALNRKTNPMQIIPRFFAESNAKARVYGTDNLSCLAPDDQEVVIMREFYVRSFLNMEDRSHEACRQARKAGLPVPMKITRSSESMRPVIKTIALEWRDIQMRRSTANPTYRSKGADKIAIPAPSTLKDWILLMEKNEFNPICLQNKHRSEKPEYFTADELVHLDKAVKSACSTTKPNIAAIHKIMEREIDLENETRAEGEKLRYPSIDTLRNRYNDLPAAYRELGRDGEETAKRDWQPVMGGRDVVRNLEEVQFDDHQTDIHVLLAKAGIWQTLTKEERKRIKRTRLWISAMICVASRSVIALHVSAQAPSMKSATMSLEMATRDKTAFAKRLGCTTAWDQGGTIEMIAVDSAAYFAHRPFRVLVNDAGTDLFLPRAGDAPARGHIERWFHTFGSSMFNFFVGRSWSSPDEKGNYDAEGHAALIAEQAAECMIRWAVDGYHNTPHSELNWATPRDRWLQLSAKYGVVPGPTGSRRTELFGPLVDRHLSVRGLRNAGLYYNSRQLQHVFRENKTETVMARLNNHDLGGIAVLTKAGWLEVPCVYPELRGVSIWQWLAATEKLRVFNKQNAKASRSVMLETFAWLKDQAEMARLEAGIVSPVLTAEDYARFEKKMDFVFELHDEKVEGHVPPEGEWHPSNELFEALDIQPVIYAKSVKEAKAETKAAKEAAESGARPDLGGVQRAAQQAAETRKAAQSVAREADAGAIQTISNIFDE